MMPFTIYLLGYTLFTMTTSEFMVAGLMPSMSQDLKQPISQIGYLITIYSLGMVVGGPLLASLLIRLTDKRALLFITLIFLIAQAAAALSPSYSLIAIARFMTGLSSAAFFGFALMAASKLVAPERLGVAASIVLGGLMIATVVGLPVATVLDQFYGWRVSFWLIVVLVAAAAIGLHRFMPEHDPVANNSLRKELASLWNRRLWAAYATSFFIIASAFSAFSYLVPYLLHQMRLHESNVPIILFVYGACSVVGNIVVGRLADRSSIGVVFCGGILQCCALSVIYLSEGAPSTALAAIAVLGLTGITLTPAMSARIFRITKNTSLINTMHTSVISAGVTIGSWTGGLAIAGGYGFASPFLLGIFFVLMAILTLAPYMKRTASHSRNG
ncbi:MFS transporter [Brenneria sp. 4F2]|nr:MFS transporter [Brenneria bubanii]